MIESIISSLPDRKSFLNGRDSIEIGYPWLTIESIQFLESIINDSFRIFECGCGGSTVFYSKRCRDVLALDSNEYWVDKLKNLRLQNSTVVHLNTNDEFLKYINCLQDNFYDIVSIDSDPGKTNRLLLANASLSKIKNFGYLILDNYDICGLENFVIDKKFIVHIFDDPSWQGKGTKIIQVIK